jgi:transposase
VDCREDLVRRQTAVKNWITSLLAHETWADRDGLWSPVGLKRLAALKLPASDRFVLDIKLDRLAHLGQWISQVEAKMQALYDHWPQAQAADAIRGIGMVTAVSVLAHIGPIGRFATAEQLISYAGLAPGHRSSDKMHHNGRIGGGGTDGHLRYLLIEAATWLQQIPRYHATHQRVAAKRGKDIARIVVARMCLRSLHKMLRDGVQFNQAPAA